MKSVQVFGVEAILAVVLALVISAVLWKGKAKSLEGASVVGGGLLLCVLLGRPVMEHSSVSLWIHFAGIGGGGALGVLVFRYLTRGQKYNPSAPNDLYNALHEIDENATAGDRQRRAR